MPFSKISAVTFDVGGTLIEPWPSVGEVYALIAGRHGFTDLDPQALNRDFVCAWKARASFDYSKTAWQQIVTESFQSNETPVSEACFEELYQFFATPNAWRVFPEVIPTLAALRARGIRLGVISNWDDRLRPLLSRLHLEHYFEMICCSCEVGFTKPAPEIFSHALGQLKLPAEQVLHIGDGEHEDFQGARSSGLHARWLRRNRPPAADFQIDSLASIIGSINTSESDTTRTADAPPSPQGRGPG
jgi:putative hydrolase of the HAD superfamily